MQQSTPLDNLESVDGGDEQRVARILSEINANESPRIISEKPLTTSMSDTRMDPAAARANIIGKSTPSMADFQSMLFQTPPGMQPLHKMDREVPPPPRTPPVSSVESLSSLILKQIRAPLVVVGIVFLLNLPVITSIISKYASWMYLGSGEISISGLFVKAILAGVLFSFYQVIATVFG